MENTIASRIKELRTHYNMGVKEFASKSGLSHVAIFHLEKGKTLRPHRSSMQRIASAFGSSADWILFGRNTMLPNGTREIYGEQTQSENLWKEEAYLEIKNRNLALEKEVERLWQMLNHFADSKEIHSMKAAG